MYEQSTMCDVRPFVMKSMVMLNEASPHKAMNLVLFDDALRHLVRLTRVIGAPRGHAILLGMGFVLAWFCVGIC
jgi:dynein heavy chain, axonemal